MKKINLLYLAVLPLAFGIWQISRNYGQHSTVFYGFAENKDTEINHDHPVQVTKIHVTPGQFVNKGELLLEATHSEFDLTLNDLTHDLEALRLRLAERKATLQADIRQLEAQRAAKVKEVELELQKLEAEMALNESLVKDLTSIDLPMGEKKLSPKQLKIKNLQEELQLVTQPIDVELAARREELATVSAPLELQMDKLETERQFYASEQKKLAITAPSDGLVGNVHCKEGEHKSSFATLITFYERNPTLVSGYVHENLILHVREGDTLQVSSSVHPEHQKLGIVMGLGSRIVEVPERLRKIPEIKTFGREVLIAIPPDNPFLQKEKVTKKPST